MAYTCSSTSSTHNIKSHSGVNGSSGGCSSSSSGAATSGHCGSAQFTASGPPGISRFADCFTSTSCSATASGQTATGALGFDIVGICFHEYPLIDPLRITGDPATVTWLYPALAIGGG